MRFCGSFSAGKRLARILGSHLVKTTAITLKIVGATYPSVGFLVFARRTRCCWPSQWFLAFMGTGSCSFHAQSGRSHHRSKNSKGVGACSRNSTACGAPRNAPFALGKSRNRADLRQFCRETPGTQQRCQPRHSPRSELLRTMWKGRIEPPESEPSLQARPSHPTVARLARGAEVLGATSTDSEYRTW